MAERQWTPAQQQCIHSHGGTLLVSAAAGSGKTSVLVERILQKITDPHHPTDVDRLLVVTFTKAAAAEMKQRLSKSLAELLAAEPDNLYLQHQQLILPRASIGTVDSFCSALVREHFFRLDISPQFRIAEEQQLSLLRKEALTETLGEFYTEQAPDFLELASMLSNGKSDAVLLSTVEKIYDFIHSHPSPRRWLSTMAEVYDADTAIERSSFGLLLLQHFRHAVTHCEQLCRAAITVAQSEATLTDKYLPALQADLSTLLQLQQFCTDTPQWDRLCTAIASFHLTPLSPVRRCTDEQAKRRVMDLRDSIKSTVKQLQSLFCITADQCREDLQDTGRLIRALYAVVSHFSTRYREKKSSQNLMDFSDIEYAALALLTEENESGILTPSPLAEELSQRYDEIMIDEYQDTNAVQDAIFSALSQKERNLFFVGDVKQSIYGFRQAMPELFIRRRTAYLPFDGNTYPATISLGNNFRSRHEVTNTVNMVFRQLMTAETSGMDYDEREALVCSAAYADGDGYQTECLILDDSERNKEETEKDAAEARVIAQRIQQLVGNLPITYKQTTRPAEFGDFCILLRSRKGHADTYRKELERAGIPVYTESDNGFLSTAEIRLVMSLLRCIDNPMQDIPLTAVMLSPLFGFTPDDMASIRLAAPSGCLYAAIGTFCKQTDSALALRCRNFRDTLDRYRLLAASLTVDKLLYRLYTDTALPELMSARQGGTVRRNNLQQLQEQCFRFEQNGFRGLSAFVRYIDRLQQQGGDLPSAQTAVQENAVRILSIHGSKGLEFPVVFLAGLGNTFNREALSADLLLHPTLGAGIKRRDPLTFNRYVTLPHQSISLALRNDQRAEDLRILYVAMTRAKEKLCLVMTLHNPDKKLASLAATLGESEVLSPFTVLDAPSMSDWILSALLRHPSASALRERIEADTLPTLSAETDIVVRFCRVPASIAVCSDESEQAALPNEKTVADIQQRIAYRYPYTELSKTPAKLAASDMAHGAMHTDFVARSRPAFMNRLGLTPAERGTALHTFMQYAQYEAAATALSDEIQRLVSNGFLREEQAEALPLSKISAFFNSELYARMKASPRCLREYPFTFLQPVDPAVSQDHEFSVIQGIADCLFEEDGALVVVDYKTDFVDAPQQLIERYRVQLEIYREALSRALSLPVKECLLYSFHLGKAISVF